MSFEPIIRAALPHEYPAVGALTATSYVDVLVDGDDDPYLSVLMDAAGRAQDAELLVAVDETDALLGTITVARPGTAFADIAREGEVEVRMLAVAPQHARRGVGRALMDRVHDLTRDEGFDRTVLSVISSNAPAVQFYNSLGYARARERDWIPSKDMDVLLEVFTRPALSSPSTVPETPPGSPRPW